MSIATVIPERTRRICAEVNRSIVRRASTLLSKSRLQMVLQAEEGMEVDGFSAFTLNSSVKHIDLSRLTVPWRMLTLAMMNQQVVVKKFIVVPEHKFYVILDLSRSMRYPLMRVYGGDHINDKEIPQIHSAKLSLLKCVAGAIVKAAIDSGYTVRVVTFGAKGIVTHPAMRHRANLLELFNDIDDYMIDATQKPQYEESLYEDVARKFMDTKGRFAFIGDFMDPAYQWDEEDAQRRWLRTLGFYRQWALNRPLGIFRINHYAEVRAVGNDIRLRGRMIHPMGDRCDVDVERTNHANETIAYEHFTRCIHRLRLQEMWERELLRALRSCCAGFTSVNSRNHQKILRAEIENVWANLTGVRAMTAKFEK